MSRTTAPDRFDFSSLSSTSSSSIRNPVPLTCPSLRPWNSSTPSCPQLPHIAGSVESAFVFVRKGTVHERLAVLCQIDVAAPTQRSDDNLAFFTNRDGIQRIVDDVNVEVRSGRPTELDSRCHHRVTDVMRDVVRGLCRAICVHDLRFGKRLHIVDKGASAVFSSQYEELQARRQFLPRVFREIFGHEHQVGWHHFHNGDAIVIQVLHEAADVVDDPNRRK